MTRRERIRVAHEPGFLLVDDQLFVLEPPPDRLQGRVGLDRLAPERRALLGCFLFEGLSDQLYGDVLVLGSSSLARRPFSPTSEAATVAAMA